MTDLLERDDLLRAMCALAEQAACGSGHSVLLSGEAGVGKTSLLERFRDVMPSGRVLWGGCEALATPRPLAPLHDVASQCGGMLAERLASGLDGAALFAALLDELSHTPSPVLLVIEDLHWADEATLDLVKYIARRIHRLPALLLLSHRDDAASLAQLRPLLGDLPTAHTTRLAVPLLSPLAVDRLAAHTQRHDAARIHAATGGNAFFVAELLRHGSGDGPVPHTVRDAVLTRAASLPAEARQVLHAVAVVTTQAPLSLLDAVLAPRVEAVDACLACGLLVIDGRGVRFRHELARAAVEASIPPLGAARLHAQVLAALARQPDGTVSFAVLAHHAERADDGVAVRRWAPLAAREAARRGARRAAAAHCRAALAVAEGMSDDERASLLDELGSHSFELNDLASAIASREEAVLLHRAAGRVEAQCAALSALAMALVRALRNAEADAASASAVALAATLPSGAPSARAEATEAYLRMLNRDLPEAITRGDRAAALAEAAGDTTTAQRAALSAGTATLFIDYAGGVARLEAVLEAARGLDDGGALLAETYQMLGSASGEMHAFDAAEAYLAQGIAVAREHDLDRAAGYMEGWRSLCDLQRGRWAVAGPRAHAAVQSQAAHTTNRVVALVALGRLRTRRGDPGVATVLDEALELGLRSGTLQRLGPVCAARAEAAWTNGDAAGTEREAARAFDLAAAKRHPWLLGELAFWRWQAARAGSDSATSSAVDESITPPSVICAEPYRLQMSGHWRDAAAAWRALGCPYEEARALSDGDEPALRVALDVLDRLGARPLAEVLRHRLRQSGARSVPRGALASTRGNAAGLTGRELEVLALLAEGCRNAEIAERLVRSTRTVEHHVEAILAKLGVASRGDAVDAAHQRGLLQAKAGRDPARNG